MENDRKIEDEAMTSAATEVATDTGEKGRVDIPTEEAMERFRRRQQIDVNGPMFGVQHNRVVAGD